ncbi:MAG: cytochrome c oxidase subunit 3 [Firmicutes bacterium]|nr:cytochrome c oxidase subunit 3 [Bacillota bacterium]
MSAIERLHPSPSEQTKIHRTGVWLFMFSESMFFVAMIKVRFDLAGSFRPAQLDQTLALVATLILLLSAVPNYLVTRGWRREDGGRATVTLVALTLLLGLAFAVLLLYEWTSLPVDAAGHYGSVFLGSLTFDLLHVVIGLLVFLSILVRGLRLRLDPHGSSLGAAGLYWYFVVAMWLVMYGVLYLA